MKVSRPLLSSLTYTLSSRPNVVYVPITSRCNARTLPETRGPNFVLPSEVVASLCRFRDFENNNNNNANNKIAPKWAHWCMYLDSQEGPQKLPPPEEEQRIGIDSTFLEYNPEIVSTLLKELQQTYTSIESLIIAGEGEPTLRLKELLELVRQFKKTSSDSNKDTTIRLTTNGLVVNNGNDDNTNAAIAQVAESLHEAGVSHVSVALMTADADQYDDELMQPINGNGRSERQSHGMVCQFIREALQVGLQVETTAVDRPDVDKEATEALSRELQVKTPVRWRPYFG